MMHPVIDQLQHRKSIRQFTGETVKEEDLDTILRTAQRAPTSINAQQISLVYTRDKTTLERIAALCGGQAHIATADVFVGIVIDFHRTDAAVASLGQTHVIEQSTEGVLVGAIDAGIMLATLQTAAEALGYGTTAIGAVRENPDAFIEMFALPQKTFLALGSTIGVPTKEAKQAPLKPRVPFEGFAMKERYDAKRVAKGALEYDALFRKFRDETGSGTMPSYTELTAKLYTSIYYRKTGKVLKTQGFDFKDNLPD
jgi:FMN reductase [NAD(P)H]